MPQRTSTSIALFLATPILASALTAQWTGEWKLDETSGTTAADLSPKKNDGTLNNFATTPSPWVKGQNGNALAFDGTDDFVEIAGNLPVFDGVGSPFSISYWLKANPQVDKRVYSEGNRNAATGRGALFTMGSGRGATTDRARVWFRNDVNQVQLTMDSVAVVYDDTWHHVAAVHVAGEFKLYVDGKLDSTSTYPAGQGTFGTFTTDRIGIGAVLRQTACCLFVGQLDDMRVYNFAMTAADVAKVFNATPLLPCSASVGTFGQGCGGTLAITATGTPQFGKVLGLKLSGGRANAPAMLAVGAPLKPLDLSVAGLPGCFAYPDLATSFLVGIGALDSTGSSVTVNAMIPSSTAAACLVGIVQGVTISGGALELSPAVVAQIGQ